MNIAKEMLAVGLAYALLGTIVSWIFMYIENPESAKNFGHWPSVVGSNFVTGTLIYIFAEVGGVNKWKCMQMN